MLKESYKEARVPVGLSPGTNPLPQASTKRSFGRSLNVWLQNFAILGAGLWAITVFVHREVLVPRRMPAHLNLSVELEKSGVMNGHVAVQMKILAENASSRTVYLLPAIYRVWSTSNNGEVLNEAEFAKVAQLNVGLNKDEMVGRFGPETERTLIAVGRVFTNWSLNPGERVVRTAVFQVPQNQYDTVIATLSLPISHQEAGLEIEWNALDVSKSKLYFQPDAGNADRGSSVDWHDSDFKHQTGFAFSTARTVLSLWEKDQDPGMPVLGEPGI